MLNYKYIYIKVFLVINKVWGIFQKYSLSVYCYLITLFPPYSVSFYSKKDISYFIYIVDRINITHVAKQYFYECSKSEKLHRNVLKSSHEEKLFASRSTYIFHTGKMYLSPDLFSLIKWFIVVVFWSIVVEEVGSFFYLPLN